MPKEQVPGKPTSRRYSQEEKAAALCVSLLRAKFARDVVEKLPVAVGEFACRIQHGKDALRFGPVIDGSRDAQVFLHGRDLVKADPQVALPVGVVGVGLGEPLGDLQGAGVVL